MSDDINAVFDRILSFSYEEACTYYAKVVNFEAGIDRDNMHRELAKRDLFFLLTCMLRRPDAMSAWCYERCREVQANPDGYLDLWAREHYKSTLAFALIIQDILNNPELTIAIFSQTRPAAKKMLRQIKQEFEENKNLQDLFPDILYKNPAKDSPKWNEDEGLVVKRAGNPKEPIDCNEPVLTMAGWKRHGDLLVGDKVFGPDGNPTTVIAVTEKWDDLPCYRVYFGNHSIVAAGTHLWEASVRHQSKSMRHEGIPSTDDWKIYTTEELRDYIDTHVGSAIGVRVTCPLQIQERVLPIDPYVFGCWLGDGSKNAGRFISSREDFPHFSEQMMKAGHNVHIYYERPNAIQFQLDKRDKTKNCLRGHDMSVVGVDKTGRCKECNKIRQRVGDSPPTLNTFPWRLRRLGVFGNKHIPQEYLLASEKQRLALLQGLMDTDGCASKKDGQAIFANINENLSEGVFFLAASLGMKPSIKKRERLYKGQPHIMWWVTFMAHIDYPPFRMVRKIENCSTAINHPRRKRHTINAVELVESRPVSCIQVDNRSGCYLVGKSLITTHNSTLESWGLVDGQPAGPHWDIIVYDDTVTKASVGTPEMIEKTNEMWELSLPLSKVGGKRRYYGTYYHNADTYHLMQKRGAVIPRIYPATKNGQADGEPVFMSREELARRRLEWGSRTFDCQMLLNPKGDNIRGFKKEWLKFWDAENFAGLNVYLFCDPAGEKKKRNNHDPDYTVFLIIGYGADRNWYVINMIRDRLKLTERADVLFEWHRKYRPGFVGYEKFGKDSDIEHYIDRMNRENYRFDITPLHSNISKNDRIDDNLGPLFEAGRIFFPHVLRYVNSEGRDRDLIEDFINDEYLAHPVAVHDDILDCLAQIGYPEVPKHAPNSCESFTPNRIHLAVNNISFARNTFKPRRDVISRRAFMP
ncbi:MAG: hypothetical protein M0R00_01360 [Candidatus Omnitrophica bacterium]|jgi:predicted phage terminase large subunit-like protein|nr:hypothetical protein [Candidatus Omnitrophota bacterium]